MTLSSEENQQLRFKIPYVNSLTITQSYNEKKQLKSYISPAPSTPRSPTRHTAAPTKRKKEKNTQIIKTNIITNDTQTKKVNRDDSNLSTILRYRSRGTFGTVF